MSVIHLSDHSSGSVRSAISEATGNVVFLATRSGLGCHPQSLDRMAGVLESSGAGLVYSDTTDQIRIDYQMGSVRDDFDFGPLMAVSKTASLEAYRRYGRDEDEALRWGGLYDLRLKLSVDRPIVRVPEPLYTEDDRDPRASGERLFDYVDPARKDYQAEMEAIVTRHLRDIGAYLEPTGRRVSGSDTDFPVRASIVIPVRNREATVGDAVASALAQAAGFEFNVIVVDNHSTDATGRVLQEIRDSRLIRLVPERTDLGIGGCWNEAVFSNQCGRYAVQLDSDDLFEDTTVLARLVGEMEENRYAMLVGSYTTVNWDMEEIPPGLVAHLEWTPENGHNNALRVNGFGAPRVYDVAILRGFGFPNVSYGEDYAVALRFSRDYEIGRVFDSVYLCRRWEGNTDSEISPPLLNMFNAYKDWIRTVEIRTRIAENLRGRASQ